MAHFLFTILLRVVILLLVTLCSATNNKNSSKPRDYRYLPFCGGQPGTNGLPGMHGMPGSPGAPGHDGRDGAKGDLGRPGKTGPQGPHGVEGKKGAMGQPGIQGPAGQKGQRGDKGDTGTPRLSSHMNWKECTWKKGDGRDSGEIYHCEFLKKYADTALHVYFAGDLRVAHCDNCCSRWYFKFNGAECSSPGSIDGAFYMWHGRKHSHHRHRHIEGHCNNIPKGKVRVGFWVGKCITGRKSADAYTGWGTMSRMFIEEVPKAQQ